MTSSRSDLRPAVAPPSAEAEARWFSRVPYASRSGPVEALPEELVDTLVRRALREDLGEGDVTSLGAIPEGRRAKARLVAKGEGRIAGLEIFAHVFRVLDPDVEWTALAEDGDACSPKDVMGRLEGDARSLLGGERTALNLVQRMSGIATTTARFVEAAGSGLRILDTRKTNPGLRPFDKLAVRCGGGESHRYGLFDEAMVKNNHVDLAGRPLERVVRDLRDSDPDLVITAEARDEKEAEAGVRGGADIVLLDNMTPARIAALAPNLRALAEERGRPVQLEASGGINLETIASFRGCGVDRVSIGALTHSAPSLDLSLYLSPLSESAVQ